jgi:diguanylate cyclase (GGDEF)-like protein
MVSDEILARARILIVDDEQPNVRLLERLLLSGGYTEMRGTTDPQEALALFDAMHPDLVLLDLHMPHLDGFAVMKTLRERRRPQDYLPILVLTADTTRETRERALSGGASDFLTKPFERTEVLLRSRNLLETRYLHLALQDENKALEARLVYQAFHDSLTGLANRALFRDRVQHALARSTRGERLAVLFLDLDNFKSVNDTLGHGEGDRLLAALGGRLKLASRECDTVARIGGDEFAVLLENVDRLDDVLLVVQRISDALRSPVVLEGREVMVTASIGVAHALGETQVDELLRNADVAMYKAKDEGKGRHAVFEPGMYAALIARLELEADLRHAVERDELRVLYQPIVELANGSITGVEALVRWQHPGHGLTPAAAFIPIAEETGLIVPIGRWVLGEACRQGRRWQLAAHGEAPAVSVNVSARQLQEPHFAADVAALLAETRFRPDRLILEITESVLLSNTTSVIERLHELKALGLRLAIDDFGTGYSNLSYLQQLPVDIIKIDKSFISHTALASTIVGLATTLKLRTVAEGIEHADQRAQLVALGCRYGQGFLFAKPISADAISELLRPVPT